METDWTLEGGGRMSLSTKKAVGMTVAPAVAKVAPVVLYELLGDGMWKTVARWSAMEFMGQPLIT